MGPIDRYRDDVWRARLKALMNYRYYKILADRSVVTDRIISMVVSVLSAGVVILWFKEHLNVAIPILAVVSTVLTAYHGTMRVAEGGAKLLSLHHAWGEQEAAWEALWNEIEDGAQIKAIRARFNELRRAEIERQKMGAEFRTRKKILLLAQDWAEMMLSNGTQPREVSAVSGTDQLPALVASGPDGPHEPGALDNEKGELNGR